MSRCLSAPDTSLPPEPSSIFCYLKLNSGIGHSGHQKPQKGTIMLWSAVFFSVCFVGWTDSPAQQPCHSPELGTYITGQSADPTDSSMRLKRSRLTSSGEVQMFLLGAQGAGYVQLLYSNIWNVGAPSDSAMGNVWQKEEECQLGRYVQILVRIVGFYEHAWNWQGI